MSATHTAPAPERAIPFARLVKVELRKSVNTVASFWLVASIAIVVVIVAGFLTIATVINGFEVSVDDFTALTAFVTSIVLPVLGIMLVTSEWSQRTAMVTFSLEPRRVRVLMAKFVVGLLLTLATVVVSIIVGFGCTSICYIAHPDATSWTLGLSDVVGFVLTQCMAMAGGFALAALLLNTPAAIVLFFVYRWAIPGILAAVAALWGAFSDVAPYLNFLEAQAPLTDLSLNTGEEWAHLLVSGLVWLVLPLGLGLWRILRAEVK